ncbi:phosphonate degradation HD-domain oxygenase [Algihabitans albus]|uniref:phosphonate degradation HD-domain oxygenase n=1 Tax=Algihabitans albus TaxID=2164067 RepID=UPI000E5D4098|nr:phosphonate degradation HD-domain oxygenase [Algihabitans albus]
MLASLSDLFDLYETHGGDRYGEDVTQVQHALQCALQAEQAAASPALISAALLHDVGHLLHRDAGAAIAAGVDDRHEALGAKTLAKVFGPEVVEPVGLHVAAKRYLCHADPGYWEVLSEASKTTLILQGGPMRKAEATAFIARPFAKEAVRLRRWDEAAKQPDLKTPDLTHYRSIAARCLPDA